MTDHARSPQPTELDAGAVVRALDGVRVVLQADGADIELVAVHDGQAQLRLLVADANCAECVLPKALLEEVALDMMRAQVPALARVVIDDPREPSA
jgi:Fe-S cluster biogenesis protein NfuA